MSKHSDQVACPDFSSEAIKLVVARLETVSPGLFFSTGNNGESYTRDEMIKRVEACDDVGKKFISTQLEFLRALKDGTLLQGITNSTP